MSQKPNRGGKREKAKKTPPKADVWDFIRGKVDNEAIQTLRQNGYSRFDKIREPQELNSRQATQYLKMKEQALNGEPIKTGSIKKETLTALMSRTKYEQLTNAKRVLNTDWGDKREINWYKENKNALDALERQLKQAKNW